MKVVIENVWCITVHVQLEMSIQNEAALNQRGPIDRQTDRWPDTSISSAT